MKIAGPPRSVSQRLLLSAQKLLCELAENLRFVKLAVGILNFLEKTEDASNFLSGKRKKKIRDTPLISLNYPPVRANYRACF